MAATHLGPLSRAEWGLFAPLLAPLSAGMPDPAAWENGVFQAVAGGQIQLLAAWVGPTPVAVLLLSEAHGLATVLAGVGALDDPALTALVGLLIDRNEAVIWNASVGEDWPQRLADLDVRPYVLQTFVQALDRVVFRTLPEDSLSLRPWEAGDAVAVATLLAEANKGTLAGLFLTMPRPPSLAACQAFLEGLLAGESGTFLPMASFVAMDGNDLRGVVLAVEDDAGRPLLLELAVHPAARGRQLSRRLVMAMQRALLAQGRAEMVFMTTEQNTPVHHLFTPDEIASTEESRGGYWIRP